MSFSPSETRDQHLSPSVTIPKEWEEARFFLEQYLLRTAEMVNIREIAQYQDVSLASGVNISETITGQAWFTPGDPNKFRYGSRTVINITGGLNDNGGGIATQTQAHGITTTANTRLTRIYGAATDPGASSLTSALPIPYTDVDAIAGGIELFVDATNVNLRYGVDYSAYTEAYVVLEWLENL